MVFLKDFGKAITTLGKLEGKAVMSVVECLDETWNNTSELVIVKKRVEKRT
ncbi:MAG: hypothetical protein ACOC38_11660 [Promethearchaeia archaeon]